jgi:hypothetical protein
LRAQIILSLPRSSLLLDSLHSQATVPRCPCCDEVDGRGYEGEGKVVMIAIVVRKGRMSVVAAVRETGVVVGIRSQE